MGFKKWTHAGLWLRHAKMFWRTSLMPCFSLLTVAWSSWDGSRVHMHARTVWSSNKSSHFSCRPVEMLPEVWCQEQTPVHQACPPVDPSQELQAPVKSEAKNCFYGFMMFFCLFFYIWILVTICYSWLRYFCCSFFLWNSSSVFWTTSFHSTFRWHEGEKIMTEFSFLGEPSL